MGAKILIWIGIVIFITIISYIGSCSSSSNNQEQFNTEVPSHHKVLRMDWESPIGKCQYTGEVDQNNTPDGYGEAFLIIIAIIEEMLSRGC